MPSALEYHDLLQAAAELQDYNGLLTTAARAERNKVQARFDSERRAIVYDLFKQGSDAEAHKDRVNADLGKIDAARRYREDAIDYAREELISHIDKQAGNNGFQRYIVRWGPPVATAAIVIAYAALKLGLLSR